MEKRVDDPDNMKRAHSVNDEFNRLSKLGESTCRSNTTGVRTRRSRSNTLSSGKKGWIGAGAKPPNPKSQPRADTTEHEPSSTQKNPTGTY